MRRVQDQSDRRRVIGRSDREFAPFFESPNRSLGRLLAPYTTEELEVILDFLSRNTERLGAETHQLIGD